MTKREYRIRWAWVNVRLTQDRYTKEKKCIAEFSVKAFGRHLFWWPLEVGEWRNHEGEAQADIDFDRKVNEESLPEPVYFKGEA